MDIDDFYVTKLTDKEWEEIGFVDVINTKNCEKNSVYDKNGHLIINGQPYKIRDQLINPELCCEIRRIHGKKSLRCAKNTNTNYVLILNSPLSKYYVAVDGKSPYDLSYNLHRLGLVNYQNIGVAENYIETIIRLTRLANKEVK